MAERVRTEEEDTLGDTVHVNAAMGHVNPASAAHDMTVDRLGPMPPHSSRDALSSMNTVDSGFASISTADSGLGDSFRPSNHADALSNQMSSVTLDDKDVLDVGFSESTVDPKEPKHANDFEESNVKELTHSLVELLKGSAQSQWQKFSQQTLALFLFAKTGDVRVLLAELWSLFSIQNDDGDTPLHMAILNEKPQVAVNFLSTALKLGCMDDSINLKNKMDQTPLMLAAIMGQDRIVASLLHCKADPTPVDKNGNNVVHLAIKHWMDGRCLRVLTGCLDHSNCDSRLRDTLQQFNFCGHSPCHMAVKCARVACLQMLLKVDPQIAEQEDSKSGFRPLHMAVELGSLPMIGELLLQADADVDAQSFTGYTALHLAVLKRHYVIAALFISANADPNTRTFELDEEAPNGETAFDMAESDEKMLAVLKGHDSATVNGAGDLEEDKPSMAHAHLSAQPSGDMQLLPHSARYRIASSLNHDAQLRRQLCHSLRLQLLCRGLETTDSPALALFDSFEAIGGSMRELHAALKHLGLAAAAQEVYLCIQSSQPHSQKHSQPHSLKHGEVANQDSGFFSGSYSPAK